MQDHWLNLGPSTLWFSLITLLPFSPDLDPAVGFQLQSYCGSIVVQAERTRSRLEQGRECTTALPVFSPLQGGGASCRMNRKYLAHFPCSPQEFWPKTGKVPWKLPKMALVPRNWCLSSKVQQKYFDHFPSYLKSLCGTQFHTPHRHLGTITNPSWPIFTAVMWVANFTPGDFQKSFMWSHIR